MRINSKRIEQITLANLLNGNTIYFTNDFEARWLAGKHCNLTVMKLDSNFLDLILIESRNEMTRLERDHELIHDLNSQSSLRDFNELNANGNNYEFESSSNFIQHFGLIFRRQSPYYHLFAQKILETQSNLIANLLYKWSRSDSDCIKNSNDLHNHKLDSLHTPNYGSIFNIGHSNVQISNDSKDNRPSSAHSDNSMLVDVQTKMAKFKKIETNIKNNVQTNHFKANSKSDKNQFYYAITEFKSNTLTNWLASLLKQIAASSSSKYQWLNRIFILFAIAISLTCLLVLVELFAVIVIKNNRAKLDGDLDKNLNTQTSAKQLFENDQQQTDKLSSLEDDCDLLVTVSNLTNNRTAEQLSRPLNRLLNKKPLITTIASLEEQLEQSSSLFNNNDDHFNNQFQCEQQFSNCDNNNLFTSKNCPAKHYFLTAPTAFNNCQVSLQLF